MAVNEKYRNQMDSVQFDSSFKENTVKLMQSAAKERKNNMIKFNRPIKIIALAAAIVALFTMCAFALSVLLTPSQVAQVVKENSIAQAFNSDDAVIMNQTVENSGFIFTLQGIASGKELISINSQQIEEERSYIVISMRKTDGSEITFDDGITFIPLFEGYEPWRVNGGMFCAGISGHIEDGVLYYLFDYANLEVFADRTVYIAGFEGIAPSSETFTMAEDGSILFADSYSGIKAMFTLPLDPAKADHEAQQKLIEQ